MVAEADLIDLVEGDSFHEAGYDGTPIIRRFGPQGTRIKGSDRRMGAEGQEPRRHDGHT